MPRAGLVVIALALALAARGAAWAEEPTLGGARISAVEGEVLVQFADDANWRSASLNMPLLPGDRLQVGPIGRIEMLLAGGAAIRLGPSSTARLVIVPPADAAPDTTAEVDLKAGRIIVVTGEGDRSRPVVTLNVPGSRIQVYPRSQVRAEVVAMDATDVLLRQGAATADTLGVSIPLRVAEVLRVGRAGAFQVAAPPQDDFDGWSESRDRILTAAPSSSPYVPTPLAPSVADLNSYGQWITLPEYGYVWRPTTIVTGWAPFTDGRWMWRGGTWVWLPREPWGWVPFHYGRWRWDAFLGWYWVPPRPKVIAWCPGAVAWIQTSSYVTWIPLAPGEIYHNPWPHGRWRAPRPPVTAIDINRVHIKKIFANAAAPGPVLAVPLATFTTSTVVAPTTTRVPPSALGASRTFGVVAPAAIAPVNASGRAAIPVVPTPTPSADTSVPQPKAPTPSAVPAAGQRPGFAAPGQRGAIGTGQVSAPAFGTTPPAGSSPQPKVDAGHTKVQGHPPGPMASSAARAAAVPVPPPTPAAAGAHSREDQGRHEPRVEQHEPRVEQRDPRWFADVRPQDRPAPRIQAPLSPAQPKPVERHSVQSAFTPPQAPEGQRNATAPIPFAAPTHTPKAHPQPDKQPVARR